MSQSFSPEQQRYLEGFFAGIAARRMQPVSLTDKAAQTEVAPEHENLTKEERIKREQHPLDAYENLLEDARTNAAPETEDVFRFKWNGLFWLNPVKDGYMCRLRIPGGVIRSFQLRELASIAKELTTGYVQVTTRANFQIRVIQPKDCPEVLKRIQRVGLHSRGAGADNIRNITASPTAGFDPYELINVLPLVEELAQTIISTREFYDLPRKFNIAFDGGGLISAVEDTNDIGWKAVRIADNSEGIAPGVYFRSALGGVTGHKAFARDFGVIVPPHDVLGVTLAILRVFIREGDRTNRKRARLKYVIDERGLDGFREAVEKQWGRSLVRLPLASSLQHGPEHPHADHPHIGVYPQAEQGHYYIGIGIPVGQLTPKQMYRLADLAEYYGRGELRLTVWQNILIPHIPTAYVDTVCRILHRMGFSVKPSPLRSGFIACTGNRYCKYAATDTKGHALQLMEALEKEVALDQPVNIHLTGCPHSCAQHYMGDIGLLGTKCKSVSGETVEGYHVALGGGFGENQQIGRQIFTGIPMSEMPTLLKKILNTYLARREGKETFQAFCSRHEIGTLQELFTNS